MNELQDDGCTLRSHLEVLERTTGRTPDQLVSRPFPHELHYLLGYFMEMSWKRQNGMSVSPLTSMEILAWQKRFGISLEAWEEGVIDRLDAMFVVSHSKKPEG